MIKQIWLEFVTSYKEYEGTGGILVLFAVGLMFMMILNIRQNKESKSPALFFAPLATIGGAFSEFFFFIYDKKYEKKSQRRLALFLALLLVVFAIALSGKRVFSRDNLVKADNGYHLSGSLVEAMDELLAKEPAGEIKIFPMPKMGDELTAYSSRFVCAYDEQYGDLTEYDETVREAYSELLDVHPDMKKVSDAAKACGSRYVILKTGLWPDVPLENYGYTLIMQNDELNVYESTEEADAP